MQALDYGPIEGFCTVAGLVRLTDNRLYSQLVPPYLPTPTPFSRFVRLGEDLQIFLEALQPPETLQPPGPLGLLTLPSPNISSALA